ncbi:hypothetical protein ABZ990_11665 [Streptomyces sp. NPDC046203]|uniref:hypothetical protein n=1 Tax=Streptomyces sp. NPDC046203 TaxID=3154602 RepID=UPI0033F814D2
MAAPHSAAPFGRHTTRQEHRQEHRHEHRTGSHKGGWVVPVLFGIAYGLYAPTIVRRGGAPTWGQLWLGIISGLAVAVAIYALQRFGHVLPRELRAFAWGALAGCAVGFLYSLSHASITASVILGLMVGLSAFAAAFYLFYTHEDAAGHSAPY